jgi:hypothetical protein
MRTFFSADNVSDRRLPRPPIDALAPENLETATFAVG